MEQRWFLNQGASDFDQTSLGALCRGVETEGARSPARIVFAMIRHFGLDRRVSIRVGRPGKRLTRVCVACPFPCPGLSDGITGRLKQFSPPTAGIHSTDETRTRPSRQSANPKTKNQA
jgi:hypothetical protein